VVIELGGRPVEYRFARRRRRTLGITVDADGLRVAAPLRAPWRDIEAFLREKERWILAKLEQWAHVPRPGVLRGASGESLPYLGVEHTLEVREGDRAVARTDGTITVSAPRSRVLTTLLGWLKARALETLTPRVARYAVALALPAPCVALSAGRRQWGVCGANGTIRLNWRLVHLAPALADYVAAHEVAHLVEMNHSKRFWSLLTGLYPAWRETRERLELAGAALPIIRRTP
jgi:predicted metal-dependent hydrolase